MGCIRPGKQYIQREGEKSKYIYLEYESGYLCQKWFNMVEIYSDSDCTSKAEDLVVVIHANQIPPIPKVSV